MVRRRLISALIGLCLALAVVLSISTCNLFGVGTLTIRNYSSSDIDLVSWQSNNGITYFFGRDTVWDYTINSGAGGWVTDGMRSLGGSDSREVEFGSDFIYFFFTTSAIGYRTAATVDVNVFTDGSFTFWDSTAVFTATLKDGSTETRTYTYVPVPGRTKPEK
jgi:hypothetical protein